MAGYTLKYVISCDICGLSATERSQAELDAARSNHSNWHKSGGIGPVWGKIRPDLPDEHNCEGCGARMHRFQPGDWPIVDSENRVHSMGSGPEHVWAGECAPEPHYVRALARARGETRP